MERPEDSGALDLVPAVDTRVVEPPDPETCAEARNLTRYIGCEFWPTVTANASLAEDFEFAVAVANASAADAKITISTSANPALKTATVKARSVATIKLPWVTGLKLKDKTFASVKQPAGAYKLTSTRPVTVYQFNALDYVLNHDCKKGPDFSLKDGKCFSYSNDASLLLPEHTLGTEYMVLSRPSMIVKSLGDTLKSPGFFSVVAARAGITTLTVTFSADTLACGGKVPAYKKGQTATFALHQGEVLQILSSLPGDCVAAKTDANGFGYCDLKDSTDLTGTIIKANQAVAVYSGHNCSFVPFDRWACDHLEEALFPVNALGKRYFGSHTTSSGTDPSVYRVVSASADNTISVPRLRVNPIKLQRGKWFEFESDYDFEVKGTGSFALVQFMVGQNYSSVKPGAGAPNDPAMALAVPVEQYLTSYRFFAPVTYKKSYVNIHAPTSATVKLDGALVNASDFSAVSSDYKVAKLELPGGAHHLEADAKVGITVYGVGSYTSYMYPGGLDLKPR